MNVSVQRNGNEATLKITAPAATVNAGYKKAVTKIADQVKIPGFRKGKAPRNIIEMQFGPEAIKQEAFEIVANEAYSKALDQEKLIPVSDPKVTNSTFEENKDMEVELTVTLKPEPELGEYKGLSVDKEEVNITDEDVEEATKELLSRGAKMVNCPDDTVIEKGDFAVIDFAGSVDGKAFDGGEGKGYPLEVGSNSFIPGFEDQLIGLKKGDSTDVKVTFPEEYFVAELAGKEAVFEVNVHEVKRKELPELNDEFVEKNTEFKTVAELKETYKKRMQEGAERDAVIVRDKALIDTAVANAKFDVPAIMIEDRISQMIEEMKLSLETRKMTLEMYMQYTGMDMAKLREQQRVAAEENVKTDLVLDAIAKAENLQLTNEDIDAEVNNIAAQHGASPKDVADIIKNNGSTGLLFANILRRKSARIIIDNAK